MAYRLTEGDKRIFKLAEKDPDIFLNYYLRSESTGSWWFPGAKSEKWASGYRKLKRKWKSEGKPQDRLEFKGKTYTVHMNHEMSEQYPDDPAFFYNHGIMLLPWSKPLFKDRTPFRVIVGGFGSGKTLNIALQYLVYAATIPYFRGFGLAPWSKQSEEVFDVLLSVIEGTLFEERFLISSKRRPNPTLIIGNDQVGESKIEFFPILQNPESIRTLTGDCAFIDQAEKIDDLKEVIRSVGTRFRGRVPQTGRERLGTLTFIANSGDNQELWDLYDMAEEDPKNYISLSPSSYDNIYLTDRDIERFKMQVGGSDEEQDQYIHGKRPVGNGEHFSRSVVQRIRSVELDRIMEEGRAKGDERFILVEERGAGIVEWQLPPLDDRKYLLISDPGTKNPPHRDSPPILVWDITEFPGQFKTDPKPATLAAFVWVYGNGDINNWANRYAEMVWKYKAIGTNGFDATGFQAGYDTWMSILESLHAEKINLAGNGKLLNLNAAKIMSSRAMMKVPASFSQLTSQLTRYEYPEPKRLRQDIAIAYMMSAWWLQRLFYYDDSEFEEREDYDPYNRYARNRAFGRYSGRLGR